MPENQTLTVLVVEDDVAVRRFIVQTLRDIGFDTLEAGTAIDGLAAFRDHGDLIDVAVIDFILPAASGLDLAAELERQRPGFKILYTSGSVHSVAMECIAKQRPEVVLAKPFTPSMLIAKIQLLISSCLQLIALAP